MTIFYAEKQDAEIDTDLVRDQPGTQKPNFAHLRHMLSEIGIWQHTHYDSPNITHGYSIDDEARGLIVGLRYWQQGIEATFNRRLARTCFDFVQSAVITEGPDRGRYHNFCHASGRWLDSIGSDDSFGRTFWSLGIAWAVDAPFAPREKAEEMLVRSLPVVDTLTARRAQAFAVLGLAASHLDDRRLRKIADSLVAAYRATADDQWQWFENFMTYCNARLPQALLAAAQIFPDEPQYREVGMATLDFLIKTMCDNKGCYDPIGNERMEAGEWFRRGEASPPLFDQQPVDAGALVEACALAAQVTGEKRYRQAAWKAFNWYLGDNIHGLPVYNSATGGVSDALTRTGLNRNQGAESVVSFHLAYLALQDMKTFFKEDQQ